MPFGEFQVHSFAPSDNCSMYHSHSQRVGCFLGRSRVPHSCFPNNYFQGGENSRSILLLLLLLIIMI